MSSQGNPEAPGPRPAGQYRGPAGLLEKLMASVRPEFRAGDLVFDPRDPVFGGPPCAVGDCERPHRQRNLCTSHWQRWRGSGLSLEEFTATAEPGWHGRRQLAPCAVAGCCYGVKGQGICQRHFRQWQRAGCPDLSRWQASDAPLPPPGTPPRTCRIGYCGLWAGGSSPFCRGHDDRWAKRGRPGLEEFVFACENPGPGQEHIDLRQLPSGLRLEMQYFLQCRGDEQEAKLPPREVHRFIAVLAGADASSLLEQPEEWWTSRWAKVRGWRPFILGARRRVEALAFGAGWETEYPRDTWRLRSLGIDGPAATISFAGIPQPWLRDLVKRHARWQLASGLTSSTAATAARALTRFAAWLAALPGPPAGPAGLTRPLLERYLAALQAEMGGQVRHRSYISALNGFLATVRRHGWDRTLPATAAIYPEDFPPRAALLPRGLAAHVMAQIEAPANLDRWASPSYRLITLILIRCGLRIADACKIPSDCVVTDSGAPYLRYYNHKMRREALVPVDEEIVGQIAVQRQRTAERWPGGTPVLFPRPHANLRGIRPTGAGGYRDALYAWLETCDIRDEHGKPVHLTPHQWRHTLGTRLINRDVPQHVVQKILDHDSPLMTAHYARLSDKTVREHWERARKVNAEGQPVQVGPDGPLGDAAWTKHQLSRATQALPNGYCELPAVKTCPHANACLTCPMFVTTAEFLPQHRAQRQQTLQIITAAEAAGQGRLAEMNKQVAGNLDKIIASLEDGEDDSGEAAVNGS